MNNYDLVNLVTVAVELAKYLKLEFLFLILYLTRVE